MANTITMFLGLLVLLLGAANAQQSCTNANLLAIINRVVTNAVNTERRMRWIGSIGRQLNIWLRLNGANTLLPGPGSTLAQLISAFSNKGFTTTEMVALSGSHTIGQARCATFRNRIYTETNIEAAFATTTRGRCPQTGGDNNLSPLDIVSPVVFNNDYYRNLVSLRGLLHSDQVLFNNGSTDAQVRNYVANPARFAADFASAMVKMASLGPPSGAVGQIRTNCRRVN